MTFEGRFRRQVFSNGRCMQGGYVATLELGQTALARMRQDVHAEPLQKLVCS
jgi:hypothetical protein